MAKFKNQIAGAILVTVTLFSGNASALALSEGAGQAKDESRQSSESKPATESPKVRGSAQASESRQASDSKQSTETQQASVTKPDNLLKLNTRFRELYAEARTQALNASYPVIICFGGSIALFDDGKKLEETNDITDQYTTEKTISHIPLALYSLLVHRTGKLDDKTTATLREAKTLIEAARGDLKEHGLSEKILARQYKIVDTSQSFIDKILAQGSIDAAQLNALTGALGKDVLTNAYEAISTQLSQIDKKVKEWKEKLGEEKFNKIKVIIAGGHMPRLQNSNFQYFARLFNVKEEGERIIYAENVQTGEEALTLLGTHVLDEGVAVSFFHDKWRMHRDLLSDGAKQYLREHPPLSGK